MILPHTFRCACLLRPIFAALCLAPSGVVCAGDPVEASLSPIMDAAVSEASPANNYGSSDLAVGKAGGSSWECFLRFDLGAIPANAVIQSAELRMQSANFGTGGTLRVSRPAAGWGEADVTWQGKPAVEMLEDIALTVDSATEATLIFTAGTMAYLQDIIVGAREDRGLHLGFPSAAADQRVDIHPRESGQGGRLVLIYTLDEILPDWTLGFARLDARLRAELFPAPEGAATPYECLWNTVPGVRYNLWESANLEDWNVADGYPLEADGLTGAHGVAPGVAARFFKVEALDEQSPEIVSRFPDDGDFGIKRFHAANEIEIRLSDATGVDPSALSLTVGALGTFTTADAELGYADGLLVFDLGGDTALGAYGATVAVSLAVADTSGNSATCDWSFELEKEVVLADGLFTFGSPDAQRTGQRVPAIPTRMLADRLGGGGPVKANDAEWTMESVTDTGVVLAYTGTSAPVFSVDQYITNLTPAHVDEIFNRRITAIHDDTANKILTLDTADVPLWEVMREGTLRLGEGDVAFEVDSDGRIVRAHAMKAVDGGAKLELDPVEVNWGGRKIMGTYTKADNSTGFRFGLPIEDMAPDGGEWDGILHADQAFLKISPTLELSAEVGAVEGLKKFLAEPSLRVDAALETRYEFLSESREATFASGDPLWQADFRIPVGSTPAWVAFSPRLKAEAGVSAGLTGHVSAGVAGGYRTSIVFDYEKDRAPNLTVAPLPGDWHFDLVEPGILLEGTAACNFKLVPELDVKVVDAFGFHVNLDPDLALDATGSLDGQTLESADLGVGFGVNLDVGMSVVGVDQGDLPVFDPIALFFWEKRWGYPDLPGEAPLAILVQPVGVSMEAGGSLQLGVQANHGEGATYQWFKDGLRLLGETNTELVIWNAGPATSGDYWVLVSRNGASVVSETASVVVGGPESGGYSAIPGGTFTMGSPTAELGRHSDETQHEVTISAFLMKKTEVTNQELLDVLNWAKDQGKLENYSTGTTVRNAEGSSHQELVDMDSRYCRIRWNSGTDSFEMKDAAYAGHPAVMVFWYGAVAWCNYRSDMDGFERCYSFDDWSCDWTKNGHRLPTESEWEYACRAGTTTAFHTGEITSATSDPNMDRAGWYSENSDTGSGRDTHPVAGKEANAWGLFDMHGNVQEWCWDRSKGDYPAGPVTDPHGPDSGTYRKSRSGDWFYGGAGRCRAAARAGFSPDRDARFFLGFRSAR